MASRRRVLVAGATGAVGKVLVPLLLARGYEVGALSRRPEGAAPSGPGSASLLHADALDPTAVERVFDTFRPDAVIHQLTAIDPSADLRKFENVFAATNRLRTEGTDNLIAAARRVGVRRFIAQSYCGWPFARTGGPIKTEDDPLDPNPLPELRSTLSALLHVERAMEQASDLGGVALRYGGFYGPGTSISREGDVVRQVKRRRLAVIGKGGGVWSFLHIEDAAGAAVAALESDRRGTYNVVDDEPAPVREWLPHLAEAVGAPRPFRVPAILAGLILPRHLMAMMTEIRGGSNARVKREFGWEPRFRTWRDGFRTGLG